MSDYIDRLNARASAIGSGKSDAEIQALLRKLETDLPIEPIPVTDMASLPGGRSALRISQTSARGVMSYGRDAAVPEIPNFTGYYLSENKLWGERGNTGFRLYRDGFIRPDGDHTQHYLEKDLIYGPQGFQGFCFDEDWMRGPQPILPWNYQAAKLAAIDRVNDEAPDDYIARLNDRARRRSSGENL